MDYIFLIGILSGIIIFALHVTASNTFPKPLSPEEEINCFKKMKNGDIDAKNKLIEHNLRLVAHIIKKYYSNSSEQDDLVSIGTIGLIKAVSTFNFEKGTRFATYAARCIENAILSQMRLWWRTNLPRAEKNPNGVFWHRFPRIFISFVPLRTAM